MKNNAVTNFQCHTREAIEINPVLESLVDKILEENICKTLSLTGVNVIPEQLHSSHCLKNRNCIIVIFSLIEKKLKDKSSDLTQLRLSGKLSISDSMYHENHQMLCRCHQLKTAGKIHSAWFYNNTVSLKLAYNDHKISHIVDMENIIGIVNLDKYITNFSF